MVLQKKGCEGKIMAEIKHQLIKDLIVEYSECSQPAKGTIIFVHGAGGGSWCWHDFMGFFSANGYNCYAINLRGHKPNPDLDNLGVLSIRDYVTDVELVISAIDKEVILFGHSMGGLISQEIAFSGKFNISSLIITGSAPPAGIKMEAPKQAGIGYKIKAFAVGLGMLYKIIRKDPLRPVLRATRHYVANCIPEDKQEELHNKLVPESSKVSIEVLKGEIKADLSKVDIPKLALAGKEDMMSLISMQRKIAEFHNMELKEYDNHAHMLMLEPGWNKVAKDVYLWLQEKVKP